MKAGLVTVTRMTRQELYELVWAEPMGRLAERFGLSDRGIAKICAKAEVPVPERGYWARVQAGRTATKPPLPAPTSAASQHVTLRPPTPRLLHRLLSLTDQAQPVAANQLAENTPPGLQWRPHDEQQSRENEQKKDAILANRLVQQSRDYRTACEIRAFVNQVAASERARLQPAEFTVWRDWALQHAERLDPMNNEHLFDRAVSDTELWSRGSY